MSKDMQTNLNKNKALARLIEGIFAFLSSFFRTRAKVAPHSQPVPPPLKVAPITPAILPVVQETVIVPVVKEEIKEAESSSLGFLVCPIGGNDELGKPLTPFTARISSVLDHSDTAIDPNSSKRWGKNAKDQKVKAFNGELGDGEATTSAPFGYTNADKTPFFPNKEVNYVGANGSGPHPKNCYLNYDGHAGYDFAYAKMTPIVAPANGDLYKAAPGKDSVYGANWTTDHSFYIEHDNGFKTWFRHCEKLAEGVEVAIGMDFSKSYRVESGKTVAYVSNFGTPPVHLHFEVRDKNGKIVDPYQDKLWKS